MKWMIGDVRRDARRGLPVFDCLIVPESVKPILDALDWFFVVRCDFFEHRWVLVALFRVKQLLGDLTGLHVA